MMLAEKFLFHSGEEEMYLYSLIMDFPLEAVSYKKQSSAVKTTDYCSK